MPDLVTPDVSLMTERKQSVTRSYPIHSRKGAMQKRYGTRSPSNLARGLTIFGHSRYSVETAREWLLVAGGECYKRLTARLSPCHAFRRKCGSALATVFRYDHWRRLT
jgi:hypothetical protein